MVALQECEPVGVDALLVLQLPTDIRSELGNSGAEVRRDSARGAPVAHRQRRRRQIGNEIGQLLQAQAAARQLIAWDINVESTVCRAHQHAVGARKGNLAVEQGQKPVLPQSNGWL